MMSARCPSAPGARPTASDLVRAALPHESAFTLVRCHALHQAGGQQCCTLCAGGGRAGYMEHPESPDGGFGSRQQRLSTDFRWGEMLHTEPSAPAAPQIWRGGQRRASAAAAALSRTAVGMCMAPLQLYTSRKPVAARSRAGIFWRRPAPAHRAPNAEAVGPSGSESAD